MLSNRDNFNLFYETLFSDDPDWLPDEDIIFVEERPARANRRVVQD